jgi:hypothetical protein
MFKIKMPNPNLQEMYEKKKLRSQASSLVNKTNKLIKDYGKS